MKPVTEALAGASARHPWRVITAWGAAVAVSLFLAVALLHGLTTDGRVTGSTESSQAGTLYDEALGRAAGRQPTDVIVVSYPNGTVDAPGFRTAVSQLAARVAAVPGVSSARFDLSGGSPLVSATRHAALIDLRTASDSDIKPVMRAVLAANGQGGMSVATCASG